MVTIIMMMMVNLDHDYTIFNLSQTWSPRTWQWLAIPFAKEGKGRLPSRSEAFDEIILIFDQKIIRLFCFLIKWSSGKTQQVQPSTLPIPLGGKRLVPGEMMRRWSWWDLDDDPVSPACSVSVSSLQCIALPSRCTSQHLWRRVTTQRYFFSSSPITIIIEGWILFLTSKRSHALSFSFDEFADVSQMFRSRPESLEPACRLLNARLWLCLHPNPEASVFIMMLPK